MLQLLTETLVLAITAAPLGVGLSFGILAGIKTAVWL
jgi:ABC-type antimicrobial peptide transport system permease subunit